MGRNEVARQSRGGTPQQSEERQRAAATVLAPPYGVTEKVGIRPRVLALLGRLVWPAPQALQQLGSSCGAARRSRVAGKPSALSQDSFRVNGFESSPGVVDGQMPVDASLALLVPNGPGPNFGLKRLSMVARAGVVQESGPESAPPGKRRLGLNRGADTALLGVRPSRGASWGGFSAHAAGRACPKAWSRNNAEAILA